MSVRREFRFVMHIEKTGTSNKTSVVKYPQHHKKNPSQQVFFYSVLYWFTKDSRRKNQTETRTV